MESDPPRFGICYRKINFTLPLKCLDLLPELRYDTFSIQRFKTFVSYFFQLGPGSLKILIFHKRGLINIFFAARLSILSPPPVALRDPGGKESRGIPRLRRRGDPARPQHGRIFSSGTRGLFNISCVGRRCLHHGLC